MGLYFATYFLRFKLIHYRNYVFFFRYFFYYSRRISYTHFLTNRIIEQFPARHRRCGPRHHLLCSYIISSICIVAHFFRLNILLDPMPRQVQILSRPRRLIVFVASVRNGLLNLCASRPIIVAGDANELGIDRHGRAPSHTVVLTVGAMAAPTACRWLFSFLVEPWTDGRNENQMVFVGHSLQNVPVLPGAAVCGPVAGQPRVKSIETTATNQIRILFGAKRRKMYILLYYLYFTLVKVEEMPTPALKIMGRRTQKGAELI